MSSNSSNETDRKLCPNCGQRGTYEHRGTYHCDALFSECPVKTYTVKRLYRDEDYEP